jgi:hypothetical protein
VLKVTTIPNSDDTQSVTNYNQLSKWFCKPEAVNVNPYDYGRTAGYPSTEECTAAAGQWPEVVKRQNPTTECEQSGAFFYPKCGSNYVASGCCICTKKASSFVELAEQSLTKHRQKRALVRLSKSKALVTVPSTAEKKTQAKSILIKYFLQYLNLGELKVDFCLGKAERCEQCRQDLAAGNKESTACLRSIPGYVLAEPTMSEVTITAHAPVLKLGGLAYLAAEKFSNEIDAEKMLQDMKNIAKIGLTDVAVKLTLRSGPMVEVDIRGTPDISGVLDNPNNCADPLTCGIVAADGKIILVQEATFQDSSISLTSRVASKPIIISPTLSLKNFAGLGPNFFTKGVYDTPPSSAVGINLGVTYTPVDGPPLVFEGNLMTEVTVAGPRVSGDLQMVGTWNNMFGVKFLHSSDLMVGLSVPLAPPPRISSLALGGKLCFGLKAEIGRAHV